MPADSSLRLVCAANVVVAMDETHARRLLLEAGSEARGEELAGLAQRLLLGDLLLVRDADADADADALDGLDDLTGAPLLTSLAVG